MNKERPTGRLSDEDLERELKGALLMDAPGHVSNELRAAIAGIPDEPSVVKAVRRRRFVALRAVLAAAAVMVIVAALGVGWTLRADFVGPGATATPTEHTTTPPSPKETASPSPMPTWATWTSLDWSASGDLPADVQTVTAVAVWNGGLIAVGARTQGGYWPPLGSDPIFLSSAGGRYWKSLEISDPTVFESAHLGGLVVASSGVVVYGQVFDQLQPMLGLTAIWISHDGLTWNEVSSGWDLRLFSIANGRNGLVAAGNANTSGTGAPKIWTSKTGETWESLSLDAGQFPEGSQLTRVRATPSGYLIGGSIGQVTAAAWWSPDGRTWQRADIGEAGGAAMMAIHAGSDGLVATGEVMWSGAPRAWWSSDGHDWQPVSMPGLPSGENANYGVFDDGSRMVAIGCANRSFRFWTSTDGRSWQELQVTRTIAADALPDWAPYPPVRVVVRSDGLVLLGTSPVPGVWLLTEH